MPKRRRTEGTKRPIDKRLVYVEQSLTTTETSSTLYLTAGACTVLGFRWSLSGLGNTSASARFFWAMVMVRDGQAASAFTLTNNGNFYEPEQDVVAFGTGTTADADAGTGPTVVYWEGTSKTSRKLRDGDNMVLIARVNANTGTIYGVVQLFCKE